jgi:hypothetical protein
LEANALVADTSRKQFVIFAEIFRAQSRFDGSKTFIF